MPVVADTGTETTSLSASLRSQTQAIHSRAERSGIVRDLLRGTIRREGYLLYLRNLLPVYVALETALTTFRSDAGVAAFARRELHRTAAIEADLSAIGGHGWRKNVPLLPSAAAYAGRLVAMADAPTGAALVAHAYVRYFGDLSGGQILRRILSKSLQLPDTALGFYDFAAIPDIEAAKISLRRALDGLGQCHETRKHVVAEAVRGFLANIEISQEVQRLLEAEPNGRQTGGAHFGLGSPVSIE